MSYADFLISYLNDKSPYWIIESETNDTVVLPYELRANTNISDTANIVIKIGQLEKIYTNTLKWYQLQ